jgi:Pyruvate/2-oxoacid:ferredoxin oxidoreductase gamma subunit
MTETDSTVDTKYLFKRNETWWVKIAVPRSLRKTLGYDLRKSLHTHDLEEAREARWAVADKLRARIEKAHKENDRRSANQDSEMAEKEGVSQIEEYIVEIVSDSGEGAQKCGQVLGLVSGKMGNGVWTVEIIPAEIQPPARERQGASGIRVRMGTKEVTNMGDEANMVVAFNEQVLYSRIGNGAYKKGTVVLLENMWAEDPEEKIREQYKDALEDFAAQGLVVHELPIQKECLKLVPDPRKGKNMFVLGMLCRIFSRDTDTARNEISKIFRATRSSRSTMTCSMPVMLSQPKTWTTHSKFQRTR